ncbi:sugar phosphate nucleotidyltransferase [Pararhizobium sp. IMCC21322]|uniref:sugar phosphate nucleotidyltransferase n=1 Tax=Pararhizobium sp. IMCC21322 TaxID=3067903 RepID=UPI002741E27A|nr:sugar phosphate nucleotidyltransferase [Pararhizobium sp. IMCC21322]
MSGREKIVLLAGGKGSRIKQGDSPPKPLTPIGENPIIAHIIDGFARQGFTDVVVALGHYKGAMRAFFSGEQSNVRIEPVDTGEDTDTGGRVLRLKSILEQDPFILAYSDAVWDVDLSNLLRFHRSHKRTATIVAVQPRLSYGLLGLNGDQVTSMIEKPMLEDLWVSAGIFVLEPDVFGHLTGDDTSWELETLPLLAGSNELMVYKHRGFWQSMDTLKDAELLNEIWEDGHAPWLQTSKKD